MEELGSLAQACGMQVAGIITQRLSAPNKAFYVGPGKVEAMDSPTPLPPYSRVLALSTL